MIKPMSTPLLRIASYNLQKCVGLDLRRRPDRTLDVIAGLGADLVVLQEADKRLPPRPAALPHAMIEEAGWKIVPFGTGANCTGVNGTAVNDTGTHGTGTHNAGASLGWHGNAMLIRPHLILRDTSRLILPGLEPRGAIRLDLDSAIGPLRVIGVHLGLMRKYRVQQIAAIVQNLGTLPPMPTVLAGDFNEWGSGVAMDKVAEGLRFLEGTASFPAARPVARLDRFALTDDLEALHQGTYLAKPARVASDHLPVWADIRRKT